jgi:hypothetical protein
MVFLLLFTGDCTYYCILYWGHGTNHLRLIKIGNQKYYGSIIIGILLLKM